MDPGPRDTLDLLDYRRQVSDLYHEVRAGGSDPATWRRWREVRDRLFAQHPQSPYQPEQRAQFQGLAYFEHDPALRVEAEVSPAPREVFELAHSADGVTGAFTVGEAAFRVRGTDCVLALYWLDQYGGGLFVPFRDATAGATTYGGGRYLLDTAKSADLGAVEGRLIFDFNYAYHPSCFHDPRWSCPLAPPHARLPVPIEAGERSTPRRA